MSRRAIATLRSHPVTRHIRAFDRRADQAVDRWRTPALDRVFYPLSSAADHSLLWVAVGAVREATGRGRPGSAVRLIGVLAVESAITNGPVKLVFRRVRPALEPPPLGAFPFGMRRPVTSAFPSGHASSAFTAAAYLARGDRMGPAYHLLAVAVSFSRVYVRLHHASDVVFGAVLGMAFGRIARRLAPGEGGTSGNAGPARRGCALGERHERPTHTGHVPRDGGST